MLRVIEQAQRTDTGRQRPHNEDSFLARPPLFAVADGMGGAQAGEVASRLAVQVLGEPLGSSNGTVAERLSDQVLEANRLIHSRAKSDSARAGMGTTLTALYVDVNSLVVVHVGDSRLYRMREGELIRVTRDHSLVEELVRQGRLTPEEALYHPQRSIITRALGPEAEVAVDSEVIGAKDGDVYLVCSDGLTAMLHESRIEEILASGGPLNAAVDQLVDEANEAGGRDNITVLALRIAVEPDPAWVTNSAPAAPEPTDETSSNDPYDEPTQVMPSSGVAVATLPSEIPDYLIEAELSDGPVGGPSRRAGKRRGLPAGPFVVLTLAICVLIGAYFASQTVYFVGSNRGLVTVYRGLPYELPAGIRLYHSNYISGVPTSDVDPKLQKSLLDHKLRSLKDANDLVSKLERGEVVTP